MIAADELEPIVGSHVAAQELAEWLRYHYGGADIYLPRRRKRGKGDGSGKRFEARGLNYHLVNALDKKLKALNAPACALDKFLDAFGGAYIKF